ncbi:MAG: efflux RND transporter periplasmic adaptor subunit [Sulfuricella sp.]
MNSKTHILPAVLAASFVFGILTGCSDKAKDKQAAVSGATVQATVITIESAVLPIVATSPGSVVAEQQAQIASRLMGFIRELNVQEGQTVAAGQRLFTVDPTDIQGQVNMARAGLAQAEAGLADAKNDYERFGTLYKEEAIPKLQWDKIRLQYQVSQQQAAAARAAFDTASAQMKYATVVAPFAGVITQKMAHAGDLASPGRPVLVLENLAMLRVQTRVAHDVFSRLKVGSDVAIQVDGQGGDAAGKVASLVPAADPVTHSYLVKIDLPQGHGLRSGGFVQVAFPLGAREGIRVPGSAILERAGITGVFVVDAQGVAQYRMVRTGAATGGNVEIQAGLNPGERVVTSSTTGLQSGDKVVSRGNGNG